MGHLKRLIGQLGPHGPLIACGYALFLAFGYLAFESSSLLAALGPAAAKSQPAFLSTAIVGRMAVYAAGLALTSRPQTGTGRLVPAALVLSAGGFALVWLASDLEPYVPAAKGLAMLLAGALLLGAGAAAISLLWARFCATLDVRSVYLFVLLSLTLSLVIYGLATCLPVSAVFPIGITLLAVSALAAWRCNLARDANVGQCGCEVGDDTGVLGRPECPGSAALARLWRPTLGTAALLFMSGLMLQMPHNADLSLAQFQTTALISQAVLNIALVLPALLVRHQPSLESIYKVALPLSATGFLLLPLIWSGAGGLANAFAQLGAGMAGAILWCMLAGVARQTSLPALTVFGAALLATNAAQLAGTITGIAYADRLGQGELALTGLALAAVYLVAMMSMFLFKGRSVPANNPSDPARDAMPASDLAPARYEQAFGLTPREAEVLMQLAGGRTIAGIAHELSVSENTVKYHVKSIYQKLGVHSRNEVIALLEREG